LDGATPGMERTGQTTRRYPLCTQAVTAPSVSTPGTQAISAPVVSAPGAQAVRTPGLQQPGTPLLVRIETDRNGYAEQSRTVRDEQLERDFTALLAGPVMDQSLEPNTRGGSNTPADDADRDVSRPLSR
jgi:hypothetical protein